MKWSRCGRRGRWRKLEGRPLSHDVIPAFAGHGCLRNVSRGLVVGSVEVLALLHKLLRTLRLEDSLVDKANVSRLALDLLVV